MIEYTLNTILCEMEMRLDAGGWKLQFMNDYDRTEEELAIFGKRLEQLTNIEDIEQHGNWRIV